MRNLEDRFWSKVNKTSGCWIWTAALDTHGYGAFGIRRESGKMRMRQASKVAWELTNGPIPKGMHTLHKCDTPACVNPDHLYLGTQADNVRDAVARGRARGAAGVRNTKARLTEWDVLEIRKKPMPSLALARAFMVSRDTIYAIWSGRTWRHLPGLL